MTFVHDFLPTFELPRIDKEDGRYYQLPDGEHVPSVTTVLSKLDKGWLAKWKKRVGEDKANRISTQAKNRGTAIHALCEKYLLNDPDPRQGSMPFNWAQFKEIRPHLDSHVSTIRGIEHRLFSKQLHAAGTTDLLCDWKGMPAIVDFKTSKYPKKEEDIWSYFVQLTAYAVMTEELYGIKVPQIVIVMVVDHNPVQIFEKSADAYLEDVYSVFQKKTVNEGTHKG